MVKEPTNNHHEGSGPDYHDQGSEPGGQERRRTELENEGQKDCTPSGNPEQPGIDRQSTCSMAMARLRVMLQRDHDKVEPAKLQPPTPIAKPLTYSTRVAPLSYWGTSIQLP